MSDSKTNNRISAVTFIVAVAWCSAWLAGYIVDTSSWTVRAGLLAAGALPAAAALMLFARRQKGFKRDLHRYLERLAQLDPHELCDNVETETSLACRTDDEWKVLVDQFRQIIRPLAERLRDLEQVRTAQEIRSRRAVAQAGRAESILAGLGDPVLAIDGFGEIALANPAARQLFDFDVEATEDRPAATLVRCEKLLDLLVGAAHHESTELRTEELEVVDPHGDSHWFRATVAKVVAGNTAESSSDGAVAVLQDIRQQRELQKRNAEFVSAASHEMKTPLAGIKAYVELLADGDAEDEETREEFLEIINGQADRLQRLIDNMLNLARIEAGVVQVRKESYSLNELLEEAAQVVQPAAEEKNVHLTVDLSPLYLGVFADRDMLLQAAINLLSNAVKYTPPGGQVTFRSRSLGDHVTFEVEDTGVGLSEEDAQRVFEKFYRVKKDKNMASGTGLGLPLAKHIVEDVHGGRLVLQSALGVGSKFTAIFPGSGQMT